MPVFDTVIVEYHPGDGAVGRAHNFALDQPLSRAQLAPLVWDAMLANIGPGALAAVLPQPPRGAKGVARRLRYACVPTGTIFVVHFANKTCTETLHFIVLDDCVEITQLLSRIE